MKFVRSVSSPKYKIFDGNEIDIICQSFSIEVEGLDIKFTFSELNKNEFEDIQEKLSSVDLLKIVNDSNFKIIHSLITYYTGEDNLRLNYLVYENYLLVFACGEFQPGRYKLYFEGCWEVD